MERLSEEQEITVKQFASWLGSITGPSDLFPPDVTGTRELAPNPRPRFPPFEQAIGEAVLCGMAA